MKTICPWEQFEPATVSFCERQLCAWITTPANTWSNLAYLAVGYYVCLLAFRENRTALAPIGVTGVLVGIGSFIFHATGTFFGEVLDISSMFFFIIFAVCMCVWRIWHFSSRTLIGVHLGLSALSIGFLIAVKWVGITIFAAYCSLWILAEVWLHLYRDEGVSYKYLWLIVLFFSTAFLVWWLDISGIVCDPDNHFVQGHAIWHILNSFCFYFLYRYHCQFVKGQEE